MRYQHSFWYDAARDIFEEAAKADAECGMAYWGVALTFSTIRTTRSRRRISRSASRQSRRPRRSAPRPSANATISTRLPSCMRMQTSSPTSSASALTSRRWRSWPRNIPPTTKHRSSMPSRLNTSASPADKTYAQQLKGAAILEPIWKRQPQHPGIAHYLIHLYDYSAIADKGLEAARLYCQDRAGGAACAAHAIAHLHPGRRLEGIDLVQHRLGEGGQGREGVRQRVPRAGLHGLRLSSTRRRQGRAGGTRRDEGVAGHRRRTHSARISHWPLRRRAT